MHFMCKRIYKTIRWSSIVTYHILPIRHLMEIKVTPDEPLVDEKLRITISGLIPEQKVTVKSSVTEGKATFSSSSCLITDAEGNVNIHKQPSLTGTYVGVDGMGPFWSMMPEEKGQRYIKRDVTTPQIINLSVYNGHHSWAECKNMKSNPVVSKELRRWFLHKSVMREDVRCGNLRGTLFIPKGTGPFPGVIDMFGGVGGLIEMRAALLASKGFISYALPYFRFEDLPKNITDINFDYMMDTVDWFSAHPMVMKGSVGLTGVSKGGELSLMLAMKCPQVKAVVNINGPPFCTFGPIGPFTDYVVYNSSAFEPTEDGYSIQHAFNDDYSIDKILKIWESEAKFLFIIGEDDVQLHPKFAQDLYNCCPVNKRHNIIIKEYPNAGHLIEPPYNPICLSAISSAFEIHLAFGGTMKDHIRAEEDSWSLMLNFFKDNLSTNFNS